MQRTARAESAAINVASGSDSGLESIMFQLKKVESGSMSRFAGSVNRARMLYDQNLVSLMVVAAIVIGVLLGIDRLCL